MKMGLFEKVVADAAADVDRYRPLIESAAADYRAARSNYESAAALGRKVVDELDGLRAEREHLQSQVAEFDAGRLSIPDNEYLAALDKLRLLGGKIAQQQPLVEARQRETRNEIEKLNHVAAGARQRLIDAVRADAAAIEKAAREALEEVLR